MTHFFTGAYKRLIATGTFLQSFVLLGMRLFWGWEFFTTGRDKLSDIAPIIEYFQSLGIPMPHLNAYVAATTECIGGFCLLIGFASRLVSLPLMFAMFVAYATAHYDAVRDILNDPENFVRQQPFNFFLTSLLVFAFGPGIFSLDAILKRFLFRKNEES